VRNSINFNQDEFIQIFLGLLPLIKQRQFRCLKRRCGYTYWRNPWTNLYFSSSLKYSSTDPKFAAIEPLWRLTSCNWQAIFLSCDSNRI